MKKMHYLAQEIPDEIWNQLQQCDVAGNEINVATLPSQQSEWRVCDQNCPSLSQCKRATNGEKA